MQWSAVKKRMEEFLAPELRGRVRYFITSYDSNRPEDGRCWIAVDGEEVFARSGLESPGIRQHFFELLRDYPNKDLKTLLGSPDPLERAIALLDRRVGNRTLKKRSEEPLSELEQRFLALRCRGSLPD